MLLRTGRRDERTVLVELQRRASLALPTYRDAILQNPNAIDLPAELLSTGRVRVAEDDGVPIGFSALFRPSRGRMELDGLFVEPARWRRGIGRALVLDLIARARSEGADAIEVTANPDAVAFYTALGFVHTGETQTRFGPAPRMRCLIADR